MIGFRHFRKVAATLKDGMVISQFEEEKQLSRFLKYLDGSITEITANDLLKVPITGSQGRNMNECLIGLSGLRKIELPESYTDIPDASFMLFGNSKGENLEIIFPSTIASIANGCLDMVLGTNITFNFTKAKRVPTITITNETEQETFGKVQQVLVPSSLYSSWISYAGWSALSNKIRAV